MVSRQRLPISAFSFDQGGNVRKSREVEAIYQVLVVNKIFDNVFINDINNILDVDYNFIDLASDRGYDFLSLLRKIQDYQSVYKNAVLSACQIKISIFKKYWRISL